MTEQAIHDVRQRRIRRQIRRGPGLTVMPMTTAFARVRASEDPLHIDL